MSEMLEKARKYEFIQGQQIKEEERPAFHITPYVGWMNDPNGFSYYKGEYHLFYQYNPYSTHWDSMHWGHVVSKDLLHWNYVPTALAPDEDYDKFGCFSGSAIELEDGRQLLMYTSVNQADTHIAHFVSLRIISQLFLRKQFADDNGIDIQEAGIDEACQ